MQRTRIHTAIRRHTSYLIHKLIQRGGKRSAQHNTEELRQSEERFKAIFQASPLAICVSTMEEGRLLDLNERYLQLIGYTREEVINRTTLELGLWIKPTDRQKVLDMLGGSFPARDIETQFRTKDGSIRDALVSIDLIALNGQNCLLTIILDVTERKQAEAALRLRNRAMIAVSSGIIITGTTRDDCPIIYCNPAFEQLTGYTLREIYGHNCRFLQGPGTDSAAIATIRDAVAAGQGCHVVLQNYRKDGTAFWNELTISPVYNQDGEPTHFIGVQVDVTNRKETEAEITSAYTHMHQLTQQVQHSRNMLRTLFDGLSDGLVLLDSAGTILAANYAMAGLLQNQVQELIGHNWNEVQPTSFGGPSGSVAQTLHDGRARHRRERLTLHDGRQRVLEVQTLPFPSGGPLEHVIVHAADVTEELQREMMAVQNEQFIASGKLAATIAHELNTPLLSIQSCLFMARKAEDERRAMYLELADEEIKRISSILDQLLDLHRPTTGAIAPVDVNALIDRVLLLTNGPLADRRIVVERRLAPELPTIWGRADYLRQVLINLILNAADAMPNGGTLYFTTTGDEAQVTIAIGDTGVGIAPELLSHIFEPFFTTKPHGSGLGLAICHKLITQQSGRIEVQSTLGQGSIFTLILPVGGLDTFVEG